MKKSEFIKKIKVPHHTKITYDNYCQFLFHPNYKVNCPYHSVSLNKLTRTPFTKQNLNHLQNQINSLGEQVKIWAKKQKKYRKTHDYKIHRSIIESKETGINLEFELVEVGIGRYDWKRIGYVKRK